MRCNLQKHKYSAALKHMTGTDCQNHTQFIDSKDKNSPSISIVNMQTIKKDEAKKDKKNIRINPQSIFNVPHTKHQSKIFKFLVESNSLREETKDKSLKYSERVKSQSQKYNGQYSERSLYQLKFFKRIERSKHEKLIQMNKNYRTNKNQLEILKKKNEDNLIQDIESLRKREQILGCQQDQPILFDINLQKIRKSKTEGNCFQDGFSLQTMEKINRFKKQEEIQKLKQSIKNKLSRRHIYHALKQKSEAFNRIKVKIRDLSNKQIFGQTSYSQNQRGSPLQFGSYRRQTKNSHPSNFKNYTLPIFQKIQDLKIQSKAAQITCDTTKPKKQNKNSNLLKTHKLFKIEHNSLSLDKYEILNPEKQCGFQVKKQQMRHKYRKNVESRRINKQPKDMMNLTTSNEGINMFRLLTPWRNDYPQ